MKCIIPAAGFGTRLKEIAEDIPKTLLKVKGKTILDRIIGKVLEIPEINEIRITTNAKFYEKFVEWKNNSNYNVKIKLKDNGVMRNEDRLGGIKDIMLSLDKNIAEDCLIVLSDNFFDFSLREIHGFFRRKNDDVLVVIDVKSLDEIKKLGCVEIDENKAIKSFVEKPTNPGSTLAATGVYFYKTATIRLFDKYLKEGNSPEGPGLFVQWLSKRKPIYCYIANSNQWQDIGSVETYRKLNEK